VDGVDVLRNTLHPALLLRFVSLVTETLHFTPSDVTADKPGPVIIAHFFELKSRSKTLDDGGWGN
jgi:hypothetical protein